MSNQITEKAASYGRRSDPRERLAELEALLAEPTPHDAARYATDLCQATREGWGAVYGAWNAGKKPIEVVKKALDLFEASLQRIDGLLSTEMIEDPRLQEYRSSVAFRTRVATLLLANQVEEVDALIAQRADLPSLH